MNWRNAPGVSESRITRLVERMVKKCLVTKHRSTRDRRSWEVGISRQGIDANVNVSAVSSEVQAELMARLPEAEHDMIYRNVKPTSKPSIKSWKIKMLNWNLPRIH